MEIWFVVGCGRSGTTFLASRLAKYSGVVALPEAQFFVEALILESEEGYEKARKYYLNHWRFKKNWTASKEAYKIEAASIKELHEYVCKLEAGDEAIVYVDHTPTNVNYTWLIESKFPDSKVLHIIRDGRAVYASGKRTDWGEQNPYKAAIWWMSQVANIDKRKYHSVVKYENLIESPDVVIRGIIDNFDVNIEECERDKNFFIPSYTRKQHVLVNKNADVTRIDSWKNELTKTEIRDFESVASNVLRINGYDPYFTHGAIRNQGFIKYYKMVYYARKNPLKKLKALIRRFF